MINIKDEKDLLTDIALLAQDCTIASQAHKHQLIRAYLLGANIPAFLVDHLDYAELVYLAETGLLEDSY